MPKLGTAAGAVEAGAQVTANAGRWVHTVQEWLVVLARSAQLQDAVGVLELGRVLDAAPDETIDKVTLVTLEDRIPHQVADAHRCGDDENHCFNA